ncbi:3036_t:CDS:2, partial [Scutellospora calospora]
LVKRHIHEQNIDIAIISNKLTLCLQPLDMSLNKLFKTKVDSFEDSSIFDFEKALGKKREIGVEEGRSHDDIDNENN